MNKGKWKTVMGPTSKEMANYSAFGSFIKSAN